MKGKKICVEMGILFLLPLAIVFSFPPQEVDQSPLPRVLKAAADYCRMFANASLNYVCLEEITEVSYSPYRVAPRPTPFARNVNHLLYDYQLIKTGEKVQEKRVLLKVKRFPYDYIILGPMLVNEYWQSMHDYRIVGREKTGKASCLVLEAVPK